jgi:transcriptional regulator with XRE-family HTH domain
MTASLGPTIERRRLRSALRRLRELAGVTQDQVAAAMDWSPSKVIRIEAGAVGISITDLRALLRLYDVTDADAINELAELARSSRKRSWWSEYKESLSPQLVSYIGLEADASAIRYYQPLALPGLLNTEAYARAVVRGTSPVPLTDADLDTRVEVRLKRQQAVLGRDNPPEVTAVLDEAVLRRRVGGVSVMRAQLAYLRRLASRPYVTMQVLPFSAGATPGLTGPFVILEFAAAADTDVVYLETQPGAIWIDKQDDVAPYRGAFDSVRGAALSPEASDALIERVADELGARTPPGGRIRRRGR